MTTPKRLDLPFSDVEIRRLRRHRGEPRGVFPKKLPELPADVVRVRDEFMNAWLDELPQKYSLVEQFNHRYPLRNLDAAATYRTLDIGAGRGEHIAYEDLGTQEYYALELRQSLADKIKARYPAVHTVVGNIESQLDFADGFFDRVLAIHILEHLPNLPRALDEIKRLLRPGGTFSVLLPCDPGFAYSIARNISARPLWERHYDVPYDLFIACEHINNPEEIRTELAKRFTFQHSAYFPLYLPIKDINLIIGYTLTH